MDLRSDYAADWQFFDNVENLTLVPIGLDGVPAEELQVTNVKAVRSYVDAKAFQAFGAVAVKPDDVVVSAWKSTMGDQVAEPGAKFVDAGSNRFEIISALHDGTVYQCLCRRIRANQ